MDQTQAVKTEIINNVMVAMSCYIQQQAVLAALEQIMQKELVRVNMEEITTLPSEKLNQVEERNKYLIQLFMVKKRDLAKGTMTGYLSAVKRLILEINGKSLDQMDEMDIDWYLSQYEKRNVSSGGRKNAATTVNNERRFLSAFYTWMRKAKLIADNPVECIPSKKVALKPIDYYTPEEMARIRDACKNPRERAIIEVFRSTGARVGELAEVKLDQVDLETGDIWIQGEKGGRYRTIYLDEDARYYYKQYLVGRKGDSQYLLPQSRKPYGKMTTCGLRSVMKTIGKRARLRCRVYPHKMRKTLGMNLKNHGVDIGTIQEVLGHASPAVTSMYYAQSTPRTLRNVRERIAI
ncbi:tyrosine-type recombinase/integrase [Enterocloster citroniae]|uniref:tyrosine-type recombinase/integrase n=1 Tax=Enterocloster citroniae TaxID=358743 RepID=UPI001D093F09|nr:tyrosine-type recombinase/integrase [Enterocloster citroniae]MCB7068133.1 tyrosine-type recombinase/integrase [Enterocloster citroniae]